MSGRDGFEEVIDRYTEKLNAAMKKKYREKSPKKSPIQDEGWWDLEKGVEGEMGELFVALINSAKFDAPPGEAMDEAGDVNNYMCELCRRVGAI